MSRGVSHAVAVGNDFVMAKHPLLTLKEPEEATIEPATPIAITPVVATVQAETIPVTIDSSQEHTRPLMRPLDLAHRYSLASFSLLFLLVGSAGIIIGGRYWTARIVSEIKPISATAPLTHTIAGLSLAVPNTQLQSELQTITSQPASITVGSQTASISPSVIKSWLTITPSGNKAQDYIQVNTSAIETSLMSIANQYVVAPVNPSNPS